MNRRRLLAGVSAAGLATGAGCLRSLEESRGDSSETIKEDAETIEYEKLYRNISDYEGEPVQYADLRLFEIAASEDGRQEYLLSLPDAEWGEDKTLYGVWNGDPFMEGDTVDIWGRVTGTKTYESLIDENTVPKIDIVEIELVE